MRHDNARDVSRGVYCVRICTVFSCRKNVAERSEGIRNAAVGLEMSTNYFGYGLSKDRPHEGAVETNELCRTHVVVVDKLSSRLNR